MHVSKPLPTEYAPHFNRYVDLVEEADFATVLAGQPAACTALLGKLSPDQAGFRYAAGKWTIPGQPPGCAAPGTTAGPSPLRNCVRHQTDAHKLP